MARIYRDPRKAIQSYHGWEGPITRRAVMAYFGYDARTTAEVEASRDMKRH